MKFKSESKKIKGVKSHNKHEDGGRLVSCQVCGPWALVDDKETGENFICEDCDAKSAKNNKE